MPDFIPTAQEQLKFLKNIQLILQSGSFSSTYKFALLISLSRLAIEKGEDNGGQLALEYSDIAEKFIELYWKQAVPYTFNDEGQLILNQNNGKQAAIVKDMPVRYLQNINGQNFEFLYQFEQSKQRLTLLPQVMFCLRQFSEIIEELCQKRWIDYIRKNSSNAPILNKLPNLEQFMFEPTRNQLNAVANILVELQECKCFYCNKVMKKGNYAVDHFIPWSMYPSDTGHNFVLADSSCNSKKSNLLASNEFLHKWQERNEEHNLIIVDQISVLGFLTDKERSHKVAEWAYEQGKANNYLMWNG